MSYHRLIVAAVGASLFALFGQWPGRAEAQVRVDVGPVHVHVGDSEPPPPMAEVEVLTRGPVHEGFAQPVILEGGEAFLISRRPPAPIEEMPPDQKPEGVHVLWIPGYWGWDADRNDFIWVSGCWRAVPPNTSWVPGYWAEVRGGYQWVAGFWDTIDAEEIEYLPTPPESLEEGPQGTSSPDNIWIPGCWVRHEGGYAWRAGFWEAARPNWVWEPAHYVYTPRGCIYVDGYWDYPIHRRGVAFLPVYCPASLYGREGFRYSPEITLDLDGMMVNLFISPQRHHYYFGDYYGPEYAREDFHPWYEARDHHGWYDPIYVHQEWRHRDDHSWADNRRADYDHRRDDKDLRPARTYEAMRTQVAHLPEKDRKQAEMARPMKEVVADKASPMKYEPVDAKTREATAKQAKDVHAYKDKRAQWEAPAAAKGGAEPKEVPGSREVVTPKEPARTLPRETPKENPKENPKETPKELPKEPGRDVRPAEQPKTPERGEVAKEAPARPVVEPEKVKISKSPIAVHEPVTNKDLTPPARPEHPKPDPSVKPRPAKTTDAPERTKDTGSPDKDKPDPSRH